MNYESMTKEQLINELKSLKDVIAEKDGKVFLAFVTSEKHDYEDIKRRVSDLVSFSDYLHNIKTNIEEFCVDFVYWNGNEFVSPFAENCWEYAVRIPTQIMKDYFNNIEEV